MRYLLSVSLQWIVYLALLSACLYTIHLREEKAWHAFALLIAVASTYIQGRAVGFERGFDKGWEHGVKAP